MLFKLFDCTDDVRISIKQLLSYYYLKLILYFLYYSEQNLNEVEEGDAE